MNKQTHYQDPLKVSCKNCGAPVEFDIIGQTYRCGYCGQLTGIQEANYREMNWRQLQKNRRAEQFPGYRMEEHRCSSCGATVVFQAGEASESCDFCRSKLIRKELTTPEQMPDLIIPFFITPQEARQRLLDWGHDHQKSPEGKKLLSNMGRMEGYYLPYQIVYGPVYGEVRRDGNYRQFYYAGYLDGTTVNTSKQLDNYVLNGMEPFDRSAARPFEYGYIAGSKVKLRDISDAETEKRVLEEVQNDFQPVVEKTLQTTGVNIRIGSGNLSVISALLPVYFIRSGSFLAVMNGQTGRISVSDNRKRITVPWVIEPSIYTVLAVLALGLFFQFDPYPVMMGGILFACLFFAVFGEGRNSLIRRILKTDRTTGAYRKERTLYFKEQGANPKDSRKPTLVFQETAPDGQMVPVKIQFYGFGRIMSIILNMILLVGAPLILAALIRFAIILGNGELFWDRFMPAGGAPWYVLTGVLVIIYWAKGVRKDAYDHPIIYRIEPSGRRHLMGSRQSRKLSFLSLFGIGERNREGKKTTISDMIRELGGIGIFLVVFLAVLFLGSTLVILL